MIDPTACPICGSHDHTPFAQKEALNVVTCRGCGFIFLAPLPQPDDSVALYDDAYAGTTEGYFAKVEKKMRRSRGRARRLRRLANGAAPKLLDVGASGGFMVQAAREVGFAPQGVELDPKSVAFARTHYPANDFFHGTVENFLKANPDATNGFDVIYCAEVIEHVPDVNGFVAAIAQLLNQEGRLYLTTPDIGHWRRPKDIARWDAFDPPAHCLYFDRPSLTRLLTKHGLCILRRDLALKPGLKVLVGKSR
jgi:SAM-dependent methyltransferase